MAFLSVILAAVATFAVGAVYYMALAKPWMAAAQIKTDENGQPLNNSPVPYIVSFIMILLVAGMMRHTFALGEIDTFFEAATTGLGVGLFFISPWIFINTGYSDRPWMLAVIDSGYASIGCLVMGIVLYLMQ